MAVVDLPLMELLARLHTATTGLSAADASQRLGEVGANVVLPRTHRSVPQRVLERLRNPLVLLLLAASLIAGLTGDVASAVVTVVVAMMSVGLDVTQEHRAVRTANALRRSMQTRATVRRDGLACDVPVDELVPGDVVQLEAGALVPADLRLLEAFDLFVNQALLTGEPYPVEKHALHEITTSQQAGPADLGSAVHLAWMGTSIVSGRGVGVVVDTGPRTLLGRVGASLQRPTPPTAFEQGTRHFGAMVLRLAVVLVGLVLLVLVWRGRPRLDAFLFATALAVGLTPELLPMIVSVTLARGVRTLAGVRVLCKRLSAVHDLGSMDLLCTDKTGTLTEARIRLQKHLDAEGRDSPRVLELAWLNSHFETGLLSPLDTAILEHAEQSAAGWRKVDEVPFDFERRRVSVLLAHDDGARWLVVKGAVEDIIRLSTRIELGGNLRELEPPRRAELLQRAEALAAEGFRVLGVACKPAPATLGHARIDDESQLAFVGFAAFEDPPKASAAAAVQALHAAGVEVKVVTGDNELVTAHVCRSLNLPVKGVLRGAELHDMDDAALGVRARETTLFCRMDPAQKSRVIMALRRAGHVVGYLGDGVNDAPPLHAADVGISVDGAADVAKEAADLVLLEHDLAVLRDGVMAGRRTCANLMKYVRMASSSNFGNMISMAAAAAFLPFLPLLPMQVLLNNFLYDLSEIPIPGDRVDDADLAQPHRWDLASVRRFMVVLGALSSVFDAATFVVLLAVCKADATQFRTGWFIESLASQVLVIFIIRSRSSPWRSRPAAALAWTAAAVVTLAVVLPWLPLAGTLGLTPLPLRWLGWLAALVATYLFLAAWLKPLAWRGLRRAST